MPSKSKKAPAAQALPTIPKELIDQFVSGPMNAQAGNAAFMAFKKALIERALGAELTRALNSGVWVRRRRRATVVFFFSFNV